MPNQTTQDTYIDDARFELLLQAILNPTPSLAPRSQLIETLGEIGGVWPISCLADRDPAEMARDEMDRTKRSLIKPLTEDDQATLDHVETILTENYAAMIAMAKADQAA
jgi:hypothetical protein